MTKPLSKFLATALFAALAACSSDGGPDYVTEIDEANMEGAAETSWEFVNDVVNGMMAGSPSADIPLAPAFEGSAFADRLLADIRARGTRRSGRPGAIAGAPMQPVSTVCEPVETGVDEEGFPIDSDGDEVPDDYKISFPANCTETEGDWVYTYSGSVRIRDVAGIYGYRIDIANLKYVEAEVGGEASYSFAVNGTESALYQASLATHSTDLSYTTVFTGLVSAPGLMTSAADQFSFKFTWDEESSFDPDGTISLEAPIPSGDFDLDLTFRAFLAGEGENLALRFHLTTPELLHFDTESCEGIDDGQLKGALNDSEDIWFLITWTGCASTTYQTHGTTDGGAPTVRKFGAR